MERYTIFASPDSLGLPVWEVFDRNVLVSSVLPTRDREQAQRAADQLNSPTV